MGDVADMMLDGILCEGCGVYMGEKCGFPRLCSFCAKERRQEGRQVAKLTCPHCKKKVKQTGLHDHIRDVHK